MFLRISLFSTTYSNPQKRERERVRMKKPMAVVVGGSIAGVSCAHTLILAGWDVVVLEKSIAPPTKSSTGAGLGLDPLSRKLIDSWLQHPDSLHKSTLSLAIDQNEATDNDSENGKKIKWRLARDESLNFRAAYWSDFHSILYDALPTHIFYWGHLFISFHTISVGAAASVKVKAKVLQTNEVVEIVADLLVAADGCLSSIRRSFLPNLKLRYSGYCAWRGVFDFSENEDSETITGIRKAYPDLGKCLYFDLGSKTHSVFYELFNKRFNWIWYVNQPEPETKGNSVTMKVSNDMIQKMQQNAEDVWIPELARVMKETKEPFLNVIYDCDPLHQIYWDNVVLIGDAAHPTTPHGLRSTNMSILDAAVLGKCLEKWGKEKLNLALEEYQSIRVAVTSKQVLHSRRMGRIKQGLALPNREPFDFKTAISPEDCHELQQKNMPFFADIPSLDHDSLLCSVCVPS